MTPTYIWLIITNHEIPITNMWLVLTFACLILELGNPGLFYFLSIAFGSFIACIASMYQVEIINQWAICLLSCVSMLFVLHRYVKKSQKNKTSQVYQSNIYLLIGKTVEIIEVTSSTSGYAKVNEEIWPVKTHSKKDLRVGMFATVTGVQGCHLQIDNSANDKLSNDSLSNTLT